MTYRAPGYDRYGKKPGRVGSLVGFVVSGVLIAAVWYGLFYALNNWPFTILWAIALFFWTVGAAVAGIFIGIGDVLNAWWPGGKNLEDEE